MIKRMQYLNITSVEGLTEARLKFCLPPLYLSEYHGSCKIRYSKDKQILSRDNKQQKSRCRIAVLMQSKSSGGLFYNWFGKNNICSLPTSFKPAWNVIRHLATRYWEVQN